MLVARGVLPATVLALLASVALAGAPGAELQGGLELVWGDRAPDAEEMQ